MNRIRLWCAAAAAAALFSSALEAQYTWRKAGDDPPGRAGHYAFFDPVRGRTTVFAGQVGEIASAYDGDTLQVDDGGYVRMDAPVLSGRGYGACCEDPLAFGCGIVFGGVDSAGTLVPGMLRWNRELHRFDPVTPAQLPPLRWVTAMALDTTRRRAVLFGGGDAWWLGDTWEWDGTNWQQRFPVQSPSPRSHHAMAFDAARNRVVLFGGHNGASLGDTWTYDGTTWTQASTPFAPGPVHNAMMAYDASTAFTVLFGGKNDAGTVFEYIWMWDGTNWSGPMALPGPGRRELGSFTYDSRRQRLVLVGGQDWGGVRHDDAWEFGTFSGGWRKLAPLPLSTPGPVPPVARHAAAYDAQRGRMVMFGGDPGMYNAVYPNTFESDGSAWVDRAPTPAPIRRSGAKMAYDSDLRRCLMIGGHGISSPIHDGLWSWNGTSWTLLSPGNPPFVGIGHAIAYDSGRRKLVLFGGSDAFNPVTNQHWEYDATTGWSQRTLSLPVLARQGHAMAYNSQSGQTYMFGGTLQSGAVTDGLMTFNGTDWFGLLPSTRPPAVTDAALCYDASRNRLVMFGGHNGSFVNDIVYEYDGNDWAMRLPTGDRPLGRYDATLVYDSNNRRCVLHGGTNGTQHFGDVWEWNGAALTWTRRPHAGVPEPRGKGALSHDPVRNRTVAFGGHDSAANRDYGDTWEWNGSTWTPKVPVVAPDARWGSAAAFDQRSGQTVLFGGRDAGGSVMSDVWTYDGTSWSEFTTLAIASARCNHAMASLWPEPGILVFGGSDGSLFSLGDCYLWDNGWNVQPGGPPPRDSHAMAYDRLRRKVVMFGGHGGFFAFLGDTWEFDVPTQTWAQRTPAHAPSARWNHTMTYDAGRGRVVLTGGYSGAYMDDVWEWDGTDWQQRSPETALPPANEGSLLAYDDARGRCVLFGRWAPTPDAAVFELSATIDAAGRGNTANPAGLRSYTQPVRGQPLRLGFDMPQGLGFYLVGLGPVQQPLLQAPAPPLCEPGSLYATMVTYLVFGGSAEPNAAWNVPNSPMVVGLTLVFQGVSLQAGGCFRATDALHVVFR